MTTIESQFKIHKIRSSVGSAVSSSFKLFFPLCVTSMKMATSVPETRRKLLYIKVISLPPSHLIRANLSPRLRRPGRKTYLLYPSSVWINSAWCYNPIQIYLHGFIYRVFQKDLNIYSGHRGHRT